MSIWSEIKISNMSWTGMWCGLVTKLCPTLVTWWTIAHQASLSKGFPRQEYWNGLPFPSSRKWKWKPLSCVPLFVTPRTSPRTSPGQNTGVGSLSLLQGIFLNQGLNPGLPHYKQIPYQLSHKGSPRILEWVAYPFSSGSSQPRNWTRVFCTADGFFTKWPNCIRR